MKLIEVLNTDDAMEVRLDDEAIFKCSYCGAPYMTEEEVKQHQLKWSH